MPIEKWYKFIDMEKTLLFLAFFLCSCFRISAEDIITITGSDKPYSNQIWFASGYGQELQQQYISQYWDKGKRITSTAYTSRGWLVTMSDNSGYTMQTYRYTADWPNDWYNKNRSEGYYVTNISFGNGKWLMVMSQGTGYTDQTYRYDDWDVCKSFIKTYWDKGYRITQALPYKNKWLVFMSKNSGIGMQTYSFSDPDKIASRIREIWDEQYRIQLLEFTNGTYFLIAYKPLNGKIGRQSYALSPSSLKTWINQEREENKMITYIGNNQEQNQNNGEPNYDAYAYYETIKETHNGVVSYKQKIPCGCCFASGRCVYCHMSGSVCSKCGGKKICVYCSGKGYLIVPKIMDNQNGNQNSNNNGVIFYGTPTNNNSGSNIYDGGNQRPSRTPCRSCSGRGTCTACGGSGKMKGSYYYTGGEEYITDCPVCHGSGKCGVCYGVGSL